jgi:antagonist of KipI
MIEILHAPPLVTVQDLGRPGYRAAGVPVGGAMDWWALRVGNLLVGNVPDAAALEWALGAGRLRFDRAVWLALTGAAVSATVNGLPIAAGEAQHAPAGSELSIDRIHRGRFAYVAVRGGIDVPLTLGSRATYIPGRLGGLDGRALRMGDRLPIGGATTASPLAGLGARPIPGPADGERAVRVVAGPHRALFSTASWDAFLGAELSVAAASDRTGYRLEGLRLPDRIPAALPSEPVCPGAIQVTTGGQPIVLMADAPTVGGYPVIAVVCSVDLPWVAQRGTGERLRFRSVSPEAAQEARARVADELAERGRLARAPAGEAPRDVG